MLKWGKSQGGVVGFSHSGWGLKIAGDTLPSDEVPPFDGIGANEYIVDVVHDAVDFISSVDTPAPWELNIWYHTLNCGYRAKLSGETDFPCIYGERVGLGRVYVKLEEGQLDFDRWCEGIKQGRSYVTDGKSHLIDFRVDNLAPGESGSELKLAQAGHGEDHRAGRRAPRPEAVGRGPLDPVAAARPEAVLGPRAGPDRRRRRKIPVEVIVNGRPVAKTEVTADGNIEGVSFDVPIEKSSWVALRVFPRRTPTRSSSSSTASRSGRRRSRPSGASRRSTSAGRRRRRPSGPPRRRPPGRPMTSRATPTSGILSESEGD